MTSGTTDPAGAPTVTIYTDGACLGNPGPGGWGAILRHEEHEKELAGGFQDTTNNRMELRAAVEALNALKRPCAVDLYTDSSYLRNGITRWIHNWRRNGWKTSSKKAVKNKDLWQALLAATERHQVNWHWTRGHVGTVDNERADALATGAAQAVGADAPLDREEE